MSKFYLEMPLSLIAQTGKGLWKRFQHDFWVEHDGCVQHRVGCNWQLTNNIRQLQTIPFNTQHEHSLHTHLAGGQYYP